MIMKFLLIETNYFEGRQSTIREKFEYKYDIIKLARQYIGMNSAQLTNLRMFNECLIEHNGVVKKLEIKKIE